MTDAEQQARLAFAVDIQKKIANALYVATTKQEIDEAYKYICQDLVDFSNR